MFVTPTELNRVVGALASGTVDVDESTPFGTVPYLIFEEAESMIYGATYVTKQFLQT